MHEIFVSYRRKDSGPYAGRLCDLLRGHLGDDAVFMDEDGIPYGDAFLGVIAERLSTCHVFLSVIGPSWLSMRQGLRGRIFQPNDTVRLETLVALNRNIRVIPLLVGGARMPPANFLPTSIAGLAGVNAKTISDFGFRQDVAALAETIAKSLSDRLPTDNTKLQLERRRVEDLIRDDLENNRPGGPRFGKLDPDRTKFEEFHSSDEAAWKKIMAAELKPQPVPESRGGVEPVLKLSDAWGAAGSKVVKSIEKTGKIVFHAVGSTGNIRGPGDMALVTDRMTQEFREAPAGKPSFLFHLGDVIYMFGEAKYYYDQFYVPYRQYPAPIFAVPGNHDGMVVPGIGNPTLAAFTENFCAEGFHETNASRSLGRTAQIQPGVYFTLEAPFVRILGLYSNILEGPGVISSQDSSCPASNQLQLRFLEAAFNRVKNERFKGAVIIAVHHDFFSSSAGSGGYGVAQIRRGTAARTIPMCYSTNDEGLKLEGYDDQHFGYLRITVDSKYLHLEFQPGSGESGDSVILSLKTRQLVLRSSDH